MNELNSILEECRDKSKQQEQDGVKRVYSFVVIVHVDEDNNSKKMSFFF